jgi:hypothetical protein
MTEEKIHLTVPTAYKEQFEKFAKDNPKSGATVFTTDSFDGTQFVHLLLELGPAMLTAVSAFIASLKVESIEININLPGSGKGE